MENTRKPGAADGSKVVPLRSEYAMFNPNLRAKLEHAAKPYTDKPPELVESFEQVLCTQLVSALRKVAARFGERAGRKLAAKMQAAR